MAKYRKKPIAIEAFQYDGDLMYSNGKYYVPDWAIEAHQNGTLYYKATGTPPSEPNKTFIKTSELFIKTLEGDMLASVGDYIIQGVNGELYPCKPDIFEKTYERISESEE